ncbi:hypothetical protein, partial [Salmonella enterica]
LWDALRMNMMISYQELVRTFLNQVAKFTVPLRFNILYINHEKKYPDNLPHMKDKVLFNVFL